MLVSMELHLDAEIDKLDNLAMNVQLDKENHMENAKTKEQTEPERAETERVEAEGIGLGTAIMKLILRKNQIDVSKIILEPLNRESERFWNKLGVKCFLYSDSY